MSRKSLFKIAAAAALLVAGSAQAQTTINAAFTVNVAFTARCETTTSGHAITFGAYSAFQAPDSSHTNIAVSPAIGLQCSRGLNPTAAFDNSGAKEGLFSTGSLRYTLTDPTRSTISGGAAATASSDGTAATYTFSFTGSLPQQAGNSVGGNLTASRDLLITF